MARCLGFYGDGISFWVVFSQSFWLRVPPGGARLVQPRWMPARRILGSGRTCSISFWPFLNSSGWWWLISSVFLTRTSCRETTHANSYYGAWPGWAVSVSVLPPTYWWVLDYFHALAIVNSVAMNIGVHVSFQIRVFPGYVPRTGISGSHATRVLYFEWFSYKILKTELFYLWFWGSHWDCLFLLEDVIHSLRLHF